MQRVGNPIILEGDDAGTGTLELHVMMMRQRRIAAGALYATYMSYHTDIVGPDTG